LGQLIFLIALAMKKRDRRVGPTKADKKAADEIAAQVNAAIALGQFNPDMKPTETPETHDARSANESLGRVRSRVADRRRRRRSRRAP